MLKAPLAFIYKEEQMQRVASNLNKERWTGQSPDDRRITEEVDVAFASDKCIVVLDIELHQKDIVKRTRKVDEDPYSKHNCLSGFQRACRPL